MGKKAYRILPRGAILFGVIVGTIAAAWVFGGCYFLSRMPAVTDISASLAFRPWWRPRNFVFSLVAFFVVGGLAIGADALSFHALRAIKRRFDT